MTERRRDLSVFPSDPQHAAAAAALQIHGFDPDGSRFIARAVVRAVQRAGVRPTDGLPTDDEVRRARSALHRRGIEITTDDGYAALLDALCPSLESQPEWHGRGYRPVKHDSECGICVLEGPDSFGNYDLIPSPQCPLHGEAP